jgi:hypothetical protein
MGRRDRSPSAPTGAMVSNIETDREARQAERVWRSVLAHGLPGAPDEYPARPLGERAWALVHSRARAGNVVGLLGAAVESSRLPVDSTQRTTMVADTAAVRALAKTADERLIDVAQVLEGTSRQRGDVVVLESLALAHTSYDDPSWRDYYGVDLLVPPGRLDASVAALVAAGATHPDPAIDAPAVSRHTAGRSLVWTDGGPVVLHGALCTGPYGQRIDAVRLRENLDSFSLGGHEMAALGREERLVHSCLGAVLAGPAPTPAQLRDIAQLVHDRHLDLDAAVLIAEAWRCDTVLAAGVRLAADAISTWVNPISVVWAQTHEPTIVERLLLRSQRGRTAAPAAALVERLGSTTSGLRRLTKRRDRD